jgi:hypothetical protein
MKPSGNTSYDPETAWNREDEDTTERLLHGLTERILDVPRFKVDIWLERRMCHWPPHRLLSSLHKPRRVDKAKPLAAKGERFPALNLG